jgi:hypothetical protein
MDKKTDNPNPEFERRFLQLEIRAAGDDQKPVIEGDAAVFDVETVVNGWFPFREKILPGAFTRVLSENPDVIGAFNHDWGYVLGRTTAGTLRLEQTGKSLRYSIDVNPEDGQAMSVYQKVKRGDVNQSSFAFTVRKNQWTEPPEDSEELPLREITEIGKLYDVGPVPFAQYPEASAQARSQCEAFLQKRTAQAAPGGAEGLEARQKARRRRIQIAEHT